MSDSGDDHRDKYGMKLESDFFADNPFRFECRSSRSASEYSDNDIAQISAIDQDSSIPVGDKKYKIQKIIARHGDSSEENEANSEKGSSENKTPSLRNRSMEEIKESSGSEDEDPKKVQNKTSVQNKVSVSVNSKEEKKEELNNSIQEQIITSKFDSSQKKRQKIFEKFRTPKKSTKFKSILESLSKQKQEQQQTTSALKKVNFQKKRLNQSDLKNWNYERMKKIEKHRNIIEHINKTIESTIKQSNEHLQIYKSFFQQRVAQLEKLVAQKFVNSENAFKNNSIAKKVYMNSSSMLDILIQKEREEKRKAGEMADLMRKSIMKGIFEEYAKSMNRQILSLREKIFSVKDALKKCDDNVCEQLIQVEKCFSRVSENLKSDNLGDFFIKELAFLRQCETEVNLEIKLGHLCLEYFRSATQECKRHSEMIKSGLMLYIDITQQVTKVKNEELSNSLSLLEEEDGEGQKLFSLEEIVPHEEAQQICKKIPQNQKVKKEKQIEKYLTELEIEEFNIRLLVIHKFEIVVCKQGKWISGEIVLTIDRYLHVFAHANLTMGTGCHSYLKPELSLKVCEVETLLMSEESEELQIKIKDRNAGSGKVMQYLMSNSKGRNEELVRFRNEDDLLEFQDYLNQLG